jgi:hypothetical protein
MPFFGAETHLTTTKHTKQLQFGDIRDEIVVLVLRGVVALLQGARVCENTHQLFHLAVPESIAQLSVNEGEGREVSLRCTGRGTEREESHCQLAQLGVTRTTRPPLVHCGCFILEALETLWVVVANLHHVRLKAVQFAIQDDIRVIVVDELLALVSHLVIQSFPIVAGVKQVRQAVRVSVDEVPTVENEFVEGVDVIIVELILKRIRCCQFK